jgi:homocitrate synthase NifV
MNNEDLAAAQGLGVDTVNLSVSVSDQQIVSKLGRSRSWVLDHIPRMIEKALAMGFEVCLGGEDSSRADLDFLFHVVAVAEQAGAKRFRFADTMGTMDPFTTREVFQQLRQACALELEIHAHNDLGLATANSLAAVLGGATHVNTTVNGLGERAGNAPLEEVVMSMQHLYNIDTKVSILRLPEISKLVADASCRQIPVNKSITGDAIFSHESGIHVSGLLRDPNNYQTIDPKQLGRNHRFILGKHSGTASLHWAYSQLGLTLEHHQAKKILDLLRNHSSSTKREPTADELLKFYHSTVRTI